MHYSYWFFFSGTSLQNIKQWIWQHQTLYIWNSIQPLFFWIITIHPLLSILVALCFSLYVCTGGQLVLAFTSRWRCWLSKLVFSEGMVSPSLEWKWIEVWLMGYSSPMSAWSLHCYMLISISASKSVKLSFTGWKLHVLFWLLVVCVVRNLYSISM